MLESKLEVSDNTFEVSESGVAGIWDSRAGFHW